ncbi:MAG: alpha/beta hydrolase, partial [Pseudomonadota bacterium]
MLILSFKVITIDIRGNGESDKPADPTYYTTEKHCQDILTVAAACGFERFTIWGYSYGRNIGRYLAAQSPCVSKLVMGGFTFGPGASGPFRRFIANFRDHWLPILQAQADKTLDVQALSAKDQDCLQRGEITVILAWLSAILDWSAVEPGDLLCPTLWLSGTRNDDVMTDMKEYEAILEATNVRTQVIEWFGSLARIHR